MIEKDTIYSVITALRDFAGQFDQGTDERMLLIGSANFMEELIRHYLSTSEPAVQVDACQCGQLPDGADACPHWKAWGKCAKRAT